jgi:hypothetical protein
MTTAVYARAVTRSTLRILRTAGEAQHRHPAVVAARCGTTMALLDQAEQGERGLGLGLVLGLCWELGVRPSALLECAQTTVPAVAMPVWADPYTVLGGADLGRLTVASGPGDMTALAGSTVALLRMFRIALRRDPVEVARVCGTTPIVLVQVESGELDPDVGLVLGLCWHLRMRPDALLWMAESRTFASGSRHPAWDSPSRLLAVTSTTSATPGRAHRDGRLAVRDVDQGRRP